jgi:hypothetical protein
MQGCRKGLQSDLRSASEGTKGIYSDKSTVHLNESAIHHNIHNSVGKSHFGTLFNGVKVTAA